MLAPLLTFCWLLCSGESNHALSPILNLPVLPVLYVSGQHRQHPHT